MWLGRKFLALILSFIFILISGIFAPDKVGAISLAIATCYGVFVTGHAATDVFNTKNNPTVKTDVKVETKTTEKEEAD